MRLRLWPVAPIRVPLPRILPVLLALFLLAACGSGPATGGISAGGGATSIAAGSKSAICQGLSTVTQSLTSLANASGSVTVGAVKTTQEKVASTLDKIVARVPNSAGLTQIQAANNELGKALQGYPDTTPIGETSVNAQGLKTKVAAVQAKASRLSSALKC